MHTNISALTSNYSSRYGIACGYCIMQFVQGGKVSQMDKILSIGWKSFVVHAPR